MMNQSNIDLVAIALDALSESFDNIVVAELGNQKLGKSTGKAFFTGNGAEHVSFDLNGKDGALVVDLSKPVPDEHVGRYDVVTNFGTSEHIASQEDVFANIHRMTKVGGAMIHSVPLVGYWLRHCPYRYKLTFPTEMAALNNYRIAANRTRSRKANTGTEMLLNFVLIKQTDAPCRLAAASIQFRGDYKRSPNNRQEVERGERDGEV